MDTLIKRRGVLKGQVTRADNYFKSVGPNDDVLEQIKERYNKLSIIFQDFESVQQEIESLIEDTDLDAQENERAIFEENYYNAMGLAAKLIKDLDVRLHRATSFQSCAENNTGDLNAAVQSLIGHQATLAELVSKLPVSTGENSSNAGSNTNESSIHHVGQSELRLKPIEIPTFNGNYRNWPEFHDLFKNLVHSNLKLSSSEKLQYLKRALVGNAQGILKNITISDANYVHAYEQLVNTFNKKDIIVDSYLQIIMEQQKLQMTSADGLRMLYNNFNEAVRALKALELPTEHWDRWLIYVLSTKLDNESLKLWRRECSQRTEGQDNTFTLLCNFINNRIYELTPAKGSNEIKSQNRLGNQTKGKHSYLASTSNSCAKCNSNHGIYLCPKFLGMSIKLRRDFVKNRSLCFNCLKEKHIVKDCPSNSVCKYCKAKHNSLLHENKEVKVNNSNDNTNQVTPLNLSCHTNVKINRTQMTILPTALVLIKDAWGQYQRCRILLDSGSQIHIINENCVQRLGLSRINSRIFINGIGDSNKNISRGQVNICLRSRYNDYKVTFQALILSKVTRDIPSNKIKITNLEKFTDLNLADPHFTVPGKVDMIVGSEIFFEILENGKIFSVGDGAIAQETKLGWVIAGKGFITNALDVNSFHTCIDIDKSLRLFWEMEELDVDTFPTKEEISAENHFVNNFRRNEQGRYIVRLPFKDNIEALGISRNAALSTLCSMERRFEQDSNLKHEYVKFIKEYQYLGHMKKVDDNDLKLPPSKCYYLPHHAVVKPSSSTTRLRVVFNASRKTSSGISLNNNLMVGPTIQPDIWSLLLKFRKHLIAYTADIAKMYRQVEMDDHDANYQRILWRDSKETDIQEFQLQTVTYGTASAPFLAVRTLKQLALDEGTTYERGAKELLQNFYVDDYMSGSNSIAEALLVKQELTELLAKGGFDLRKWSSNSIEFLDTIDENHREVAFDLPLQEDTKIKVLGLRWHPKADNFTFEVNLDSRNNFSKRIILSESSKLYDPLGLISPCTFIAKCIMQQIWISGVDWDDPLPNILENKYGEFRKQLSLLSNLKIPRYLKIHQDSEIQLCGFADASELGYAAVIYLRTVQGDEISVTMLASKTRVAPIRQISLPRLELCAALLLAKLISKVKTVMNLTSIDTYAYTDSTVVLAWLKAIPRKWKTFVANKTSKILALIPFCQWRHVKSANNAADPASRGVFPENIIDLQLWWNGPSFLHTTNFNYNTAIDKNLDTKLECRKQNVFHVNITDDVAENYFYNDIIHRFSSLRKLVRVVARCLRFFSNLKASINKSVLNFNNVLDIAELEKAMNVLIKCSQQAEFKTELSLIRKNKVLQKGSNLYSLMPIIDKNDILRVGGRIQEADMPFNKKHPIVLGKSSRLVVLILDDIHKKYFHANQQLMLNVINAKYWIIGCKNLVKKCIRNCTICMRYKAEGYTQQMGNLPLFRIQPSRPFTNTGTDFAGPFTIRTWNGRGAKRIKCYVAIFVCMATKALHIELVSDLSTDRFLAALHRFISRRGACSNIYSDNGKNFVGAARKLSEIYQFLQENYEEIAKELANYEMKWNFIPVYSPNFGGIWESAVKSLKYHMKRSIGETVLTYEEMSTVLCQFEACLNSRPIALGAHDVDNVEPLTPAHFLTQGPIMLPLQDYIDENTTPFNRWKLLQRVQLSFWKRWSQEYISTLQQRKKWATRSTNIQINDIVLIKDDNLPPGKWLMGRVIGTKPGKDGLVRVVSLKTQNGIIERSIRKLAVFLSNEIKN